jgi:hypothetical protein
LVGVTCSSSRPIAVVPINRQAGPTATPGTLPRRNRMTSSPNRQSIMISTAKRRVIEPSALLSTVRK